MASIKLQIVIAGLTRNPPFPLLPLFPLFPLFLLLSCNSPKTRDFETILEKGEINVLTLSGSMSYFIYKGEPEGYEYELLSGFADNYNLKINIRLAENEAKLTELLLKGDDDLIAYNIPVTKEGGKKVLFCGREVINEQVLIQRTNKGDTLLNDVTDLIGKEVWVIHDSKYFRCLKNLNKEIGGGIIIRIIEKDTVIVEDLLEMVSKGDISYTISDLDMALFNKTYYNNINTDLSVSHPQCSSWAVRKKSAGLAKAINDWFEETKNAPQYQRIMKRYFEMSKMPGNELIPIINSRQISNFDHFFKEYAQQIDWDWRLLASISYQESKFLTDLSSWAGAAGLMGLMPRTAAKLGLPKEKIYDPEENIKTAVELIRRLKLLFSTIENEDERIKFILASYNSGSGHITDAQALAEKYKKNPNIWKDVEEYLILKKRPEYYKDPVCKSGYYRGTEKNNYVQNVIERWHYYRGKVKG